MRTVLLLLTRATVAVALVAGASPLGAAAVAALRLDRGISHVLERLAARLRKVGRSASYRDGAGDDRSRDPACTTAIAVTTRTLLLGERSGQRRVLLLALAAQKVGAVAPRVEAHGHRGLIRGQATTVLSRFLTGQMTESLLLYHIIVQSAILWSYVAILL